MLLVPPSRSLATPISTRQWTTHRWAMIKLLSETLKLDRLDAYALASVAMDCASRPQGSEVPVHCWCETKPSFSVRGRPLPGRFLQLLGASCSISFTATMRLAPVGVGARLSHGTFGRGSSPRL
jgi:hypothetical protein